MASLNSDLSYLRMNLKGKTIKSVRVKKYKRSDLSQLILTFQDGNTAMFQVWWNPPTIREPEFYMQFKNKKGETIARDGTPMPNGPIYSKP